MCELHVFTPSASQSFKGTAVSLLDTLNWIRQPDLLYTLYTRHIPPTSLLRFCTATYQDEYNDGMTTIFITHRAITFEIVAFTRLAEIFFLLFFSDKMFVLLWHSWRMDLRALYLKMGMDGVLFLVLITPT